MAYTIHLLKNYNNYYNRQLKKRANINDYINDSDIFIASFTKRNFDFNDGIFTRLIIQYGKDSEGVFYDYPTPNYIIVENETDHSFTRWFVIQTNQTRGKQFDLQVKRDVIAEYFEPLKVSPCIIRKGYVGNNSVLAFNKEQQNYNKVKSKELLLKDKTQSGYVIGFIDSTSDHGGDIKSTYHDDLQVNFEYSDLGSYQDYFAIGNATPNSTVKIISGNLKSNMTLKVKMGVRASYERIDLDHKFFYNAYSGQIYVDNSGNAVRQSYVNDSVIGLTKYGNASFYSKGATQTNADNAIPTTNLRVYNVNNYSNVDTACNNFTTAYENLLATNFSHYNLTSLASTYFNTNAGLYSVLEDYNGKICKIGSTYYKCSIESYSSQTEQATMSNISLWKLMLPTEAEVNTMASQHLIPSYFSSHGVNNAQLSDFELYAHTTNYYVKLNPQETEIKTVLTPSNSRIHLNDAPYDMFVIPYSDTLEYEYNGSDYTANKLMALNMAQAIAIASGSATYDVQIVPFCPFQDAAVQQTKPDFTTFNAEAIKNSSNTTIGYYFWCSNSSMNFNISETRDELTLSHGESYKEITDLMQYILCSPDKAVQWEFNPAMNRGITNWKVSIDYRPFSSYIKIQPEWDYLYSLDSSTYNGLTDSRGLIFNGAYSVTQLSSAWANYVNSNKNYQAIFDTQINTQIKQNEIQNKAAWETMFARSFSINPFAGLTAYGNVKDQLMTEELQGVTLASQRKLFNYQLDNIQSQPRTISKLTSINSDFRIFPFVEIYETSSEDKTFYNNMIRYNGMTIMAVGYINDYLQDNEETFIQATLIRYNQAMKIENDYQVVEEINKELDKGVYITKEV